MEGGPDHPLYNLGHKTCHASLNVTLALLAYVKAVLPVLECHIKRFLAVESCAGALLPPIPPKSRFIFYRNLVATVLVPVLIDT